MSPALPTTSYIPISTTRKGRLKWQLVVAPLVFETRFGPVEIPTGHTTDGPSDNWLMRFFIRPHLIWDASVLHDHLIGQRPDLTKRECDQAFRDEASKTLSPFQLWLIYRLVRLKTWR